MSDTSRLVGGDTFRDFAARRRSTRDFLPTPIAPELIDDIVSDAMTAPSWSNTRPYMVAVASGEVRDRIATEFTRRWDEGSAALRGNWWRKALFALRGGLPRSDYRILRRYPTDLQERSHKIGRDMYAHLGIDRGDRAGRDAQWRRNFDFFGAPVEIFIFVHGGLEPFSASDAGLFMQNLMLSAHARGLGTCAQGAAAVWPDVVRAEFDVPAQYKLLCGIAVGYPTDSSINSFGAERLPASVITVPPRSNR